MLLLVWIHSYTEPEDIPEMDNLFDTRTYKMNAPGNMGLMDNFANHVLQTDTKVAFVPESSFQPLSTFLRAYSGLPASRFMNFDNEDQLKKYVKDHKYGLDSDHLGLSAAVVDRQMYVGQALPETPQFSYDIRMNASLTITKYNTQSVPDTRLEPVNKMERGYVTEDWYRYHNKGFFLLQSLTDLFILNTTGAVTLSPAPTVEEVEKLLQVQIQPFPNPAYQKDLFATFVGEYIGMFFTLTFIWPVTRIVASIVEEKELKIKEGMKIMGLRSSALTLSWVITYGIMFLISCLLIVGGTGSNLYANSSQIMVFIFFLAFCASVFSFSFLMSTLFDKANMGSTFSAIIFLASFFFYYPVKDDTVARGTKIIASLFPSVALALGSTAGAKLESSQIGITPTSISTVYGNFAFSDALFMLTVDTVLYFVLALYLEQVMPSEYGIQKPWHFIFSWCFTKKSAGALDEALLDDGATESDDLMTLNEPYTKMEPLSTHERGNEMVRTRNLRKAFPVRIDNSDQKEFVAVRNLSLDMYKGQIFTLLGHNGAGKSTTISMLCGLYSPTSGSAKILGRDIATEMDELRRNFGFCPQHDLLYPYLSVEEHLRLYCAIKGVPPHDQDRQISEMIDAVGLGVSGDNKRHALAGTLSGGQMRKLSVGIALLNDSPIVFLDEPSSGMDVASQRFIWELLLKSKKDRVILLTTHSMEEAEIGDKIAILAHSVLQCCGSSLFLKNNYGVGYTLSISKSQSEQASLAHSDKLNSLVLFPGCTTASGSAIASFVTSAFPFAELLSDAGGEVSFRLPFSHTGSFPELFEALEAEKQKLGIATFGVSVTTLTEVFLRVGHGQEAPAETGCVSGPTSPAKPEDLNDSFGADLEVSMSAADLALPSPISLNSPNGASYEVLSSPLSPQDTKPEQYDMDDVYNDDQRILTGFALFSKHTRALLTKRYHSARRDRKQWMWQLLYPAIILISSLILQKLNGSPEYPARSIAADMYDMPTPLPYTNINDDANIAQFVSALPKSVFDLQTVTAKDMNIVPTPDTLPSDVIAAFPSANDFIISDPNANQLNYTPVTRKDFTKYLLHTGMSQKSPRYLGLAINEYNPGASAAAGRPFVDMLMYFNTSAHDSLPVIWNTITNGLLRAHLRVNTPDEEAPAASTGYLAGLWSAVFGAEKKLAAGTPSITTNSKPFDRTENEMIWANSSVAFTIAMAFAFVPATFAGFIVKERADKGKHLQIISGVSPYAYWFATLAWDLINYTLPYIMTMIILFIFDIDSLLGEAFLAVTVIFWMFCLSVAPFIYCLSFLFDNHSAAQNLTLLLNFLLSVILLIVEVVMDIIPSTHDLNYVLRFFYRLLPPFCFGEALAGTVMRKSPSYFAVPPSVWSFKIAGWPLVFMFLDFILYSVILMMLEYASTHNTFEAIASYFRPHDLDFPVEEEEEDSDVRAEREAIQNGRCDDYSTYPIVLKGVRKVYPSRMGAKPHIAVNNLFFSVKKGECFGFLGANGAGKSTTMKVLSGDVYPTSGTAMLGGFDILDQTDSVRRLIGYCPQFDALLPLMTAREHLFMYARIKCVHEAKIAGFVEYLLEKLGLTHLADKPAGTYSGGNKRKLSVGISIVGNPAIVFLDEPSTGVDPQSRRAMWKLISSTMRHRSVILTTHSMEEAEALCDRTSIMTSGRLRAIGTPQHLKSKFGNGWQLIVKTRDHCEQQVKDGIRRQYPGMVVLEEHGSNLKLRVPSAGLTLADVFRYLEANKNVLGMDSYAVCETTLEQIFVSMVQQDLDRAQREREADLGDDIIIQTP